jgi:hypothetical protein
MKKQEKKLSLNKRTISNLIPTEMNHLVGGATSVNYSQGGCNGGGGNTKNCTVNQKTCDGHNTCQYTCS